MSSFDGSYLDLVERVMAKGDKRPSRVGPTRQIFGEQLKIDTLTKGLFPIITSRQIFYKPVLGELAAFLRGATMLSEFKAFGCNYWDANARVWPRNIGWEVEDHLVGRIYGAQWRRWTGPNNSTLDQISELVRTISTDPFGRRHLLTAYNPAEINQGCLPPCHLFAQFNVNDTGRLDCIVYMRSVDLCLGLPSDIILYATLLLLVSKAVYRKPGAITFFLGDTHIYENHIPQFVKQLGQDVYELPTFDLALETSLNTFKPEHLTLNNYHHGGKLVYPFAY